MKAYTTLEQSKMLADILPIESVDMEYMFLKKDGSEVSNVPFVKDGFEEPECCYIFIPCWSLAALLNIIHYPTLTQEDNKQWVACSYPPNHLGYASKFYNNPIDACVAMIIKLHEQKIL